MIESRLETLRFSLSFLGVPFRTFVVRHLASATLADMSCFVQMLSPDGLPHQLGVFRLQSRRKRLHDDAVSVSYQLDAQGGPRWPPSLSFQTSGCATGGLAETGMCAAMVLPEASPERSPIALPKNLSNKLSCVIFGIWKYLNASFNSRMWGRRHQGEPVRPICSMAIRLS